MSINQRHLPKEECWFWLKAFSDGHYINVLLSPQGLASDVNAITKGCMWHSVCLSLCCGQAIMILQRVSTAHASFRQTQEYYNYTCLALNVLIHKSKTFQWSMLAQKIKFWIDFTKPRFTSSVPIFKLRKTCQSSAFRFSVKLVQQILSVMLRVHRTVWKRQRSWDHRVVG